LCQDLPWRGNDDKKQSLIVFSASFDGYDRDQWPAMAEWLSNNMRRLQATFSGPLQQANKMFHAQTGEEA